MARGNFKQKRGGGRNFSKHLELDENGTAVSTDKWARRGKNEDSDEDSDEDEESEESEEESEEDPAAPGAPGPELSRAERKQLKKQGKAGPADAASDDDQDPILANPNIAAGKKLNIADLAAPRELTRREREEKEKKDAKERYWKLHEQGKTEQAKADLARLAKIRAEREAAQARRKAEAEAKSAEIEAKRQEQTKRRS